MTGPEHYRKAEELLETAAVCEADGASISGDRCRTEAAVHASLALAAATAMQAPVEGCEGGMTVAEWRAWARVAATRQDGGA